MEEASNKFVAIKGNIDGGPEESDFEIKSETIWVWLKANEVEVIVKNLYVSVDPYQLNRMKSPSSWPYAGETRSGWSYEVCKPKKGDSVFVSAASGSMGSLVGQYAKLFGCRVVSCAGTQQKVDLLKEKLGFDDAFNYKEENDLKSALKRYFPDGMDIYFDNVGGKMLEAAVANMKQFGRVAVCGVMSEYTGNGKRAALDMLDVVYKRITIQGFLAADYLKCYADFMKTTTDHLRTGKMHSLCDISHGVESVPGAFVGLFSGENIGKKIVQIADQ
ncbi:2-alkenal reductase (NADP(+)-dependent)-like [Salvia splendens]|uniref:2-alkenal reductase (NADP(+)-dependent)-like n=1 Tax=Salvia splendens TaxID=180675 RepID=UPI001C27B813|nr:2-alkenal reductase (NADP(+)-dependent)-like [Salvia splendens]